MMNRDVVAGPSPLTFKRFFTGLVTLLFSIVATFGHPAFAQAIGNDFESPIIEHEPISTPSLWGDVQVFEATVVDNNEIKQVRLFYRFAGDELFTEIQMQRLASSSSYTASVDTSLFGEPRSAIEYYIRAEDLSDNLVLRGFAFEPLIRPMISGNEIAETPGATSTGAVDEPAEKKGVNWLYVALGVLLLGGLAAGGGGGGGSDGGGAPTGPCDTNCTVTLSIDTP